MREYQRIVVAGAGAIGSTVACVLARAGRRVLVADPSPFGANASGIAAGMLAPAFEALFDRAPAQIYGVFAAAREAWPALADAVGVRLSRDGALALGDRDEVERWAAELAAVGAGVRVLAPAAASGLARDLPVGAWALLAPGDWRLDPLPALAALRRAAAAAGAVFTHDAVRDFDAGYVHFDGAPPLAADALVVATGAARSLEALAPELAALSPIKGHIIRARADIAPQPVIRTPAAYACQAAGEIIVGATMEPGRSDTAIDPAAVQSLVDAAAPLTASLGPLDWKAAAGVRASTADGLPLVGWGRTNGVILAVGARRNGWLLAPLIAKAVLAVVEGAAGPAEARLFDPARGRL